jgi:mevalonate kinase
MALSNNELFYSKVLLFGEYSIIRGHKSLAIPFELFSGKLKLSAQNDEKNSNAELKGLLKYLKKIEFDKTCPMDLKSFEFDINHGLYFDSTIPHGHGVGSSGAVCASIYDRYVTRKESRFNNFNNEQLAELKNNLSLMESHFHGSSSGVDPLISYINTPLIIEKKVLEKTQIPIQGEGKSVIFLLDTKRSRRTEPLVNLFLEKCKNEQFQELLDTKLAGHLEDSIRSFINVNLDKLFESFKGISEFQFEHFLPMIPKLYQELWEAGLENPLYKLKLCGSGGGGFILGLTRDFEEFCTLYPNEQVRVVFRF